MHQMTLSVQDDNWNEFKKHFLITHPNQTKDWDHPLNDDDWVFHRIHLFARGAYEKGVKQLFDTTSQPPIVDDILTHL